jgi:hypothetical protein
VNSRILGGVVLTLYVPGGPFWVAESSETVISFKCFGICICVLRDALRDGVTNVLEKKNLKRASGTLNFRLEYHARLERWYKIRWNVSFWTYEV